METSVVLLVLWVHHDFFLDDSDSTIFFLVIGLLFLFSSISISSLNYRLALFTLPVNFENEVNGEPGTKKHDELVSVDICLELLA